MEFAGTVSVRGRRVYLVGLQIGRVSRAVAEDHLEELSALARSAGARVVGSFIQARQAPHPATLIGSGRARWLGEAAKPLKVDVVLFDDDLTAGQVRELEKRIRRPVLDRSGLILELFSQRARTSEACTQVELARLEYLLPRLTRRWSHLSRQVGGIGQRGGEGEKQLEADRRMLRRRIAQLKKKLGKLETTRVVQRRGGRQIPTIALAGYTNAGKTTLFNRLTGADDLAQDRLFATLDSKVRRGALAPGVVVVFADTVGFIRKLPHDLVASFRSTLGEVVDADLVLHVIDASHPQVEEQRRVAEEVLHDLGVEKERQLLVCNKVDRPGTDWCEERQEAVSVSALDGSGLDKLRSRISAMLGLEARTFTRPGFPASMSSN